MKISDLNWILFVRLPEFASGPFRKRIRRWISRKIQQTLLAFGHGFAFVGREYPLEIDGDIFYIDLLFYHIPSHKYIVVEFLCGAPHKSSYVA